MIDQAFIQHNLYWIIPLALVEAVLKSITLWKSARRNQLYWFIALIIFNTAGILPLVYLVFFSERGGDK